MLFPLYMPTLALRNAWIISIFPWAMARYFKIMQVPLPRTFRKQSYIWRSEFWGTCTSLVKRLRSREQETGLSLTSFILFSKKLKTDTLHQLLPLPSSPTTEAKEGFSFTLYPPAFRNYHNALPFLKFGWY